MSCHELDHVHSFENGFLQIEHILIQSKFVITKLGEIQEVRDEKIHHLLAEIESLQNVLRLRYLFMNFSKDRVILFLLLKSFLLLRFSSPISLISSAYDDAQLFLYLFILRIYLSYLEIKLLTQVWKFISYRLNRLDHTFEIWCVQNRVSLWLLWSFEIGHFFFRQNLIFYRIFRKDVVNKRLNFGLSRIDQTNLVFLEHFWNVHFQIVLFFFEQNVISWLCRVLLQFL